MRQVYKIAVDSVEKPESEPELVFHQNLNPPLYHKIRKVNIHESLCILNIISFKFSFHCVTIQKPSRTDIPDHLNNYLITECCHKISVLLLAFLWQLRDCQVALL